MSGSTTSSDEKQSEDTSTRHAVGYIRSATGEASALQRQRRAIRAHCKAHGWPLRRIFEDTAISGRTLDRPGLQAALANLHSKDVLVVTDMNRLYRGLDGVAALKRTIEEKGADLSCTKQ